MTSPEIYNETYFQRMRGADTGEATNPLYDSFPSLVEDVSFQNMTILDLGCGRGELLYRFASRGATDLWGLDFSPAAVRECQSRLTGLLTDSVERRIIQASAADSDTFLEQQFDLIFMMDVVEHLPPPILAQALRNCRVWLKQGGRLVIHTFPTLGPHRLYQALLTLSNQKDKLAEMNAIHCNVQTRATLRQSLADAQLIVEKLWLQNDITLASNAFHHLPNGPLKSIIGCFIDKIIPAPPVFALLTALGLSEYASPSIYCFASR
jgi:SAM-dependent methyltransferase